MFRELFSTFSGFGQKSAVDDLLEKQDVTLEQILEEGETINEVKLNNKKLMEFLTKEKVAKLIEYATELPQEQDGNNRVFRYPFVSSEILSSDSPLILDMFLEESKDFNIPIGNDKQYLLTLKFKKELISKSNNKQTEDRGMEAETNPDRSEPTDNFANSNTNNIEQNNIELINDKVEELTKSSQNPPKQLTLKSALRTTPRQTKADQFIESDEMIEYDDEFKEIQREDDAGGNYEEEFEKATNSEQRYLNDNDEFSQNEGFDIFQELEDENRVNKAILKSEEEERLKEAQSNNEENVFTKKEASEDYSQNDSFPCIITKNK